MWCYRIKYNHDGENAVKYILAAEPYPDDVKTQFYNYLRSLNISFLIHEVELVDFEEAWLVERNKNNFCFIQKEEY